MLSNFCRRDIFQVLSIQYYDLAFLFRNLFWTSYGNVHCKLVGNEGLLVLQSRVGVVLLIFFETD